jgi:hypothetical protein
MAALPRISSVALIFFSRSKRESLQVLGKSVSSNPEEGALYSSYQFIM